MIIKNMLRILICLLVFFGYPFLSINKVMADEFSGNRLQAEWQYTNPGETFLLPVYSFDIQNHAIDHGTKLLLASPEKDWRIETQISPANDISSIHSGLCLYLDELNYILFGLNGDMNASAYGIVGGKQLAKLNGRRLEGAYFYYAIEKKDDRYSFFASNDGKTWDILPDGFTDDGQNLKRAQIGIFNRYTGKFVDIFHSHDKEIPAWFVEYKNFSINGEIIPFPEEYQENTQNRWSLSKSMGVFVMPVRNGASGALMPKLLRPVKAGDWTFEGMLSYYSAPREADSLAGVALYANDDNYLILGVKNGYGTPVRFEVSGMIDGEPTGPLAEITMPQFGDRTLRITKRIQDGLFPTYYFYAPNNTYLGKFVDETLVFSNAMYGGMASEISNNNDAAHVAVFEHFSEIIRDAFVDHFDGGVLDGIWEPHNAETQMGKERVVIKSDPEKSGAILRHQMKSDWIIDAYMADVLANSEAGLALIAKQNFLYFITDGNDLIMRSEKGETKIAAKEGVSHLRMIKNGNFYTMLYSENGFAWQTAFEYTCEDGAFKNSKYGLVVKGQGTFYKFSETLRPTGAIAGISQIEMIGALTGEDSMNQTESRCGMGSTDLGSLFEYKGKIYGVYGDTFSRAKLEGHWIHNAVSVGVADNPATGIKFEEVYIGKDGRGAVTPTTPYKCAIIPTCGFGYEIDGIDTLYMWVHEIYGWSVPGHRDVRGSGWAISTDGGETWHYDRPMFDGNSHFQFVTSIMDDDMLYLFGNLGGGYGETYLMRVSAKDALDRNAYQFYAGLDKNKKPIWSKAEEDAVWVLENSYRENGIVYNAYLGKYLMTGLDTINDQVVLHESSSLFGPWGPSIPLFARYRTPVPDSRIRIPHSYGAYSLTNMVSGDGKTMYFTLSHYNPYQVFWLGVTFDVSQKEILK